MSFCTPLSRNAVQCTKRVALRLTPASKAISLFSQRSAFSLLYRRQYHNAPMLGRAAVGVPCIRNAANVGRIFQRHYSVIEEEGSAPVIDFNKMKTIVKEENPGFVVVDVREPDEYKTGHIPGAINIPCKSSPGAFGLSPEEFKLTFGFAKPAKDKTLVFYCLGGIRSSISEELAGTCEYSKRLNYKGSWEDWVANKGAIEYPKEEKAAEKEPAEPEKAAEKTEQEPKKE
ncbi:hypothetical protein BRETT_001328 [Brettanomyces bruxellensis]|uniref:Rhodanese domain-containing protein n=1 Tax=Dekkera bruxellensis TaxID=5007 RepID=A0A871R4Y7_DEKBR|nr:uncharacterized protein BRETT_001328 [Brettanomyces bruxellensis]QOU21603.1 hypothetical protein BRETT_001328 [Brettanomyces bruxellensis]